MRRPSLRLAAALVLLTLYYQVLLGTTSPVPASTVDVAARDIDASQVAFSAGRYADALEPTERLTKTFPSQAIYFERLARIQHELGRPREEARAWEAVFRTSPTPVDACPMLAEAYERTHDAAGALHAYERCAEIDAQNADLLLFLGRAYDAAGRGASARQALERALAVAPEYPDVHLLLAMRDFADGDIGTARNRFERFLALAPGRRDEVADWLERARQPAP